MRIIFIGSGSFACPAVAALKHSAKDELVAVITQPDRPKGRKLQMTACSVKQLADQETIPVLSPEKITAPESEEAIRELRPDLLIVADYGQFIPSTILNIPPMGAINIHPSLLPKYRGAAPIQWSIANGDTMTGVTILYVTEKMDAGDMILQQEFEIGVDDTSMTLESRLAEHGAELLLRAIDIIRSGHIHRMSQDEKAVTLARKLGKADGKIDWSWPAETIRNRIRGFQPWPGCYFETERGLVKVFKAHVENQNGKPGEILSCDGGGPVIGTAQGALRLLSVQPEGKNVMSGTSFICGLRSTVGSFLT